MSQVVGCFNKPSKKEIVDKFDDFITMFPSEDLTFLYDKKGDTSNLEEGDLGTWIVSSFKYSEVNEENKVIGVVIKFNRNTRQATGVFNIREGQVDNDYPIFYDSNGLHLVDEDVSKEVKSELNKFKLAYEFISLDRPYLDGMESEIYYNGEVPLYDITYKLSEYDKNIKMSKEVYTDLPVDKDNSKLTLEGDGSPWSTTSMLGVRIEFGVSEFNTIKASLHFSRSEELQNVTEGK